MIPAAVALLCLFTVHVATLVAQIFGEKRATADREREISRSSDKVPLLARLASALNGCCFCVLHHFALLFCRSRSRLDRCWKAPQDFEAVSSSPHLRTATRPLPPATVRDDYKPGGTSLKLCELGLRLSTGGSASCGRSRRLASASGVIGRTLAVLEAAYGVHRASEHC